MRNYLVGIMLVFFFALTSCEYHVRNAYETYVSHENDVIEYAKGFVCDSTYYQREHSNSYDDKLYDLLDILSGECCSKMEDYIKDIFFENVCLIRECKEKHNENIENIVDLNNTHDNPQYAFIDGKKSDSKQNDKRMNLEGLTIHELFEPREFYVWGEGDLFPIRMYPFGEIMAFDEFGLSSFVIYFNYDACFHTIYQEGNILRRISTVSTFDYPFTILFEVTQIENKTVANALEKFKQEMGFNLHRYTFFHRPGDEELTMLTQQKNLEILFYVITVYNRKVYLYDKALYEVVRVFVRDNLRGGVFIITSRFPEEAVFGAGIFHSTFVSTFKILD